MNQDTMREALATAERLIDEAMTVHIYSEDDTVPDDCNYVLGLARIRAAIAEIDAENVPTITPQPVRQAATPTADGTLTVDGGAVPCVATCQFCGSEAVSADATVIWGKDEQAWILADTCDTNYCDNCGGECSLKFEPLEVAK